MQLQRANRAAKYWAQAAGSVAQEQPGDAAGSSSTQGIFAAQTLLEVASVSSKALGHTLERSSTSASTRLVQDAGRVTLRRRQTEGELDLTLLGFLKVSVCLWVCMPAAVGCQGGRWPSVRLHCQLCLTDLRFVVGVWVGFCSYLLKTHCHLAEPGPHCHLQT